MEIYQKIKLKCPDGRKVMSSVHQDFGHMKNVREHEEMGADFAGPLLPKTKKRNVHFLVLMVNCTKFQTNISIYPCPQANSAVVDNSLKEGIKYRGKPARVRGDNAHNLTGSEVTNIL